MYMLQVRKKKITDQAKRIHNEQVRQWKLTGSVGLKPKLYKTVEEIFEHGLEHPSYGGVLQNATSAVSKSTR